jgi:hypothetical protein
MKHFLHYRTTGVLFMKFVNIKHTFYYRLPILYMKFLLYSKFANLILSYRVKAAGIVE